MSTAEQLMTADELLRMPDDGFRYELVKGELRKMAPAGHEPGRVAINFTWRLAQHVATNQLGVVYAAETGFKLAANPDTVRAPDVGFVCRERLAEVKSASGFWPGAPDLAVEVVSPGDTYTEVQEKAIDWLAAGAQVVLALNPRKRTVTVYRSLSDIVILNDDAALDLDDVVTGFKISIKDIFD
jgi:Uma2 family endonuclease